MTPAPKIDWTITVGASEYEMTRRPIATIPMEKPANHNLDVRSERTMCPGRRTVISDIMSTARFSIRLFMLKHAEDRRLKTMPRIISRHQEFVEWVATLVEE
jgi:hypothetical protein